MYNAIPAFVYICIKELINGIVLFLVRSEPKMNKSLGLILSTLFIASILVGVIPLATTLSQASITVPPGQIGAVYIGSLFGQPVNSVLFVVNVSNVNLTSISSNTYNAITYLILNVTNNIKFTLATYNFSTSSTTSIPISFTKNLVTPPGTTITYYVYYSSTEKAIFFFITIIGTCAYNTPEIIPISYLENYLPYLTVGTTYVYNSSVDNVTTLANLNKDYVTTNPLGYMIDDTTGNPLVNEPGTTGYTLLTEFVNYQTYSKSPYNLEGYIVGQLSQFTIARVTLGPSTTNEIVVFGPLAFITSPSQAGLFNPMQANGNLGSILQSQAYTRPVIWGRALINFTIVDALTGGNVPANLTFQLNYSVPGPLQISFAQMAYIASINNYPSTFQFSAYTFANGYMSFFGVITTINDTYLGNIQLTPSGEFTIGTQTFYLYLLTLSPSITKNENGSAVEYVSNLCIQYSTVVGTSTTVNKVEVFYYQHPGTYTLPVYGYNIPAPTQLTGTFYTQTYTVTVSQPSTPTLVFYTGLIQLKATAYEGVYEISGNNYPDYFGGLLSTPPSTLSITGSSVVSAQGFLTSTYAKASVTLLTNATLQYPMIPAGDYSFNGIIVTPAYPIINGTSAMTYMLTANYVTPPTIDEYELSIVGTQEPMIVQNMDLVGVQLLPYFQLTLAAPTVPATTTASAPLTLEFVTVPQYAYITLVELGLWGNETSVVVTAFGTDDQVSVNHGYFYGIIIPPRISVTTPVSPVNFICYNSPSLYIYDPDSILVPGYANGTFSIADLTLNFTNEPFYGALVLYQGSTTTGPIHGNTVYMASGYFPENYSLKKYTTLTPEVEYEYITNLGSPFEPTQLEGLIYGTQMPYQIYITTPTTQTEADLLFYLPQFASNNPTVNYFFEQAVYMTSPNGPYAVPVYMSGLSVTGILAGNLVPAFNEPGTPPQVGYIELVPPAAPPTAPYPGAAIPNITVSMYVTYKVVNATVGTTMVTAGLYVGSSNTMYMVTTNYTFVNSGYSIVYKSTDYAVFHAFMTTKLYKAIAQIEVPNITDMFYFPSGVIPLYSTTADLILYEPYYASVNPTYLSIGSNNVISLEIWNSPLYKLVNVPATAQFLGYIQSISVTYPNGQTVSIALTNANLSTFFTQLVAEQFIACNGTFTFEINVQGIAQILHTNVISLNGSTLTVVYYDYVTHELLTAKAKLVALTGIVPIAIKPGQVEYFLTAYPYYPNITFAPPWFIAETVSIPPFLSVSDKQFAQSNPTTILAEELTNITVVGPHGKAMVYYNATSGDTIVVNAYGVTTTIPGNVMPTLPETGPGTGVFNGTISFVIVENSTIIPVPVTSTFTAYTNGSLAIVLNGKPYVLGPAGDFVLPFVTYTGVAIGYNATVYVTVSDPVQSATFMTQLTPINFTPIRLAPFTVPPVVPIPHAPKLYYEYNGSIVITPSAQVIKIFVSSVIPYPLEFQIQAFVYPKSGFNVQTATPTVTAVYFSYQAVRAYPALGIGTPVPYLLVYVQLEGISSLPAGQYVIVLSAVPFAQGPVLSEYPTELIFTNVTITS
ncbi:MAG: hypothetical protein RXR43_09325 [Sulfolobus sp.]